jgi:hypothetical protein
MGKIWVFPEQHLEKFTETSLHAAYNPIHRVKKEESNCLRGVSQGNFAISITLYQERRF